MSARGELSLSFLDVLSNALGALILVFVVFSLLPHHGERASRKQRSSKASGDTSVIPAHGIGQQHEDPQLFAVTVAGSDVTGVEMLGQARGASNATRMPEQHSPGSVTFFVRWTVLPGGSTEVPGGLKLILPGGADGRYRDYVVELAALRYPEKYRRSPPERIATVTRREVKLLQRKEVGLQLEESP